MPRREEERGEGEKNKPTRSRVQRAKSGGFPFFFFFLRLKSLFLSLEIDRSMIACLLPRFPAPRAPRATTKLIRKFTFFFSRETRTRDHPKKIDQSDLEISLTSLYFFLEKKPRDSLSKPVEKEK